MIKNIFITFILLPNLIFCQDKSLNFNQANDIEFSKQFKNYAKFDSYTTKDGLLIKIGDTLVIGKAKKKKEKYIFNDVYSYITKGKTRGNKNDNIDFLPHYFSGDKVVVLSIFATHSSSDDYKLWTSRKSMPLYISLYVKNPNKGSGSGSLVSAIGNSSVRTITDIDKALSSDEIVNDNKPLSRSEAILKLKESKDLLDIGLMSESDYNILKDKLTPIIMNQ